MLKVEEKNEFPSELFLPHLNKDGDIPQYIQLFRAFQQSIIDGKLVKGSKLPATRPLASSLGVSRNTVKSAFELLQAEGYIETRKGAGSFVAKNFPLPIDSTRSHTKQAHKDAPPQLSDLAARLNWQDYNRTSHSALVLAPALPALQYFPWMQWQRAVNHAGRYMKYEISASALGDESLREQISSYLHVVRGVKCDASNILIFSGSQPAVYLALQLLLNPGDGIFVEDPCYFGIDGAINAIGAIKHPIGIDEQGFKLTQEQQRLAKVAMVTPSRNYPLGYTMSLSRRLALIQWAKEHNGWIVEDDYDSEFRFDGPPLTSLQGLGGQDKVIYTGTFSRILHPSIRLGYLVLPDVLVTPFMRAKRLIQGDLPLLPQLSLAEFMGRGQFSGHVRRMRKLYQQRRSHLHRLMNQHFSNKLSLVDSDGGMHSVYLLPEGLSDRLIVDKAKAESIGVQPLSQYYSREEKKQGLVIGFAGYNEQEQEAAVKILATIILPLIID